MEDGGGGRAEGIMACLLFCILKVAILSKPMNRRLVVSKRQSDLCGSGHKNKRSVAQAKKHHLCLFTSAHG